ncbi:E3 ubiquitin-protein ligase bre1 [Pseudogymnoascus destructans]|uniref:E3 ubiquitin protein ligase n=2 Tax=Pseudogymnoascus destructans TaxID=655981 RepID=L8FR45_PSED2|nr:E3 ubiquitin-protein ligase bre1 [Pseudogymnoascus destructans]ELR03455.1 hypothetical protein GMDG_06188 [Pseudogymnoascus destructans 20631-21]OAF63220.1 E3 ubiquitin-protein ligase bre1 [Pseudogymnoascus destructans]
MKVAAPTIGPLPATIIKMEDRKRAAGQSVDDLAPPTKRQAMNGGSKVSVDADMPWKDDLERYQKDAILRQMTEYKREKALLESELKDVRKRSVDHDDHLRVVDAWWSQLLDEVRLLTKNSAPSTFTVDAPFPTATNFENSVVFSDHLASKAKQIKEMVANIMANLDTSPEKRTDEVQDLQQKLNKLLASHKDEMVKYDRMRVENEQAKERLESASLRALKLERKLERSKSLTVAKLEQQAIAGTGNSAGSGIGSVENGFDTRAQVANGSKDTEAKVEASQVALKEAVAVSDKQKQQLEELFTENKSITEQLTAANARLANLTEDDYARTELFKNFKSQHEEVIKRINHLEATNIQLREEAEKLQAERTTYRTQLQNEAETVKEELESQLQRLDSDLARVRSTRDELLADQTMRKANQDQERTAIGQMKELVSAKEDRVTSLESEVQRLKSLVEGSCETTPKPEIEGLDLAELQRKYVTLEQSFSSVNNELPAMEKAYKRAVATASKKVMDFAALEEKVSILIAEKSKADQKYFAARKDMDTRIGEVRALRAQNSKSSEIITQLKDVESSNRTIVAGLEKQLSDARQLYNSTVLDHKKLQLTSSESASKLENLRAQVSELTNMLRSKDTALSTTKQRAQSVETELEQVRARFEQSEKEKETWKAKSLSNQSGEEEMLRMLALCTICRNNFKNTVLKTCGHLFCNHCVENRLANRMRKCPNCSKAFDKMDVMTVHM